MIVKQTYSHKELTKVEVYFSPNPDPNVDIRETVIVGITFLDKNGKVLNTMGKLPNKNADDFNAGYMNSINRRINGSKD